MKKSKKLMILGLSAATAAVAATSAVSSFAWFATNKTVTASGMKIKATAEGSVVITAGSIPASGLSTTDYNFGETTATALYASTHDLTEESSALKYSTGLKRVSNAENINVETGLVKNNEAESALTYEVATNGTGTNATSYYRDYTVYIAGDRQAFTNQNLTVSLAGTIANSKEINKAISVDFYGLASVSSTDTTIFAKDNYLGTLNVAGKKNNSNGNGNEDYKSFTVNGVEIPQANANSAYGVLMRVYYDGALIEQGGTNAYTSYSSASGNAAAGTYYYTDDKGTSISSVKTGDSVAGLYVVDPTASTYAYARTSKVGELSDVTLTATFTVSSAS